MQEGSATAASSRREILSADHELFHDTLRCFIARQVMPSHATWERQGLPRR